jgi:isopentenyldiphosphate isomerase
MREKLMNLIKGKYEMVKQDRTFFVQSFIVSLDLVADDFDINSDEVEKVKWFSKDSLVEGVDPGDIKILKSINFILDKDKDFMEILS